MVSVKVEEGDHLAVLFGLLTRFQQEFAVVEGEADDLLHPADNVPVADPAENTPLILCLLIKRQGVN